MNLQEDCGNEQVVWVLALHQFYTAIHHQKQNLHQYGNKMQEMKHCKKSHHTVKVKKRHYMKQAGIPMQKKLQLGEEKPSTPRT